MQTREKWVVLCLLSLLPFHLGAMGLRSFVALPLEKGGKVLRVQFERNMHTDGEVLSTEFAYGFSGKQTVLLSVPYRLSPSGSDRLKDMSVLYRHTIWQVDESHSTFRLALLGGGIIPTESERDGKLQAGLVTTFYADRHEFDFDLIGRNGLGSDTNTAQYDLSWQYRLTPAIYPEWGRASEWDSVLELNGRMEQGEKTTHQITAGLQWIHSLWVLEGGLIKDLTEPNDNRVLASIRIHF